MGVKNMFKKSSKIFDREGFYIVLFVCLCIVAVAAVYISRNNADINKRLTSDNKTNVEQTDGKTNADLVEDTDNKTVPASTNSSNNNSKTSSITNTANKTSSNSSKQISTAKSSFKLQMPVEGEISRPFSNTAPVQYPAIGGALEVHEGIDIRAEIGTEVKAAEAGTVSRVSADPVLEGNAVTAYGFSIEIDHGNGVKTVYCNLDPDKVPEGIKAGKKVKKGDVIGYVGDSYYKELAEDDGPHLHFVVLEKTKGNKTYDIVDPSKYLNLKK